MKSTKKQGDLDHLDHRVFPPIRSKSIDTSERILSRIGSFSSVRGRRVFGFKGLKIEKMSKCGLGNIEGPMARRLFIGHWLPRKVPICAGALRP